MYISYSSYIPKALVALLAWLSQISYTFCIQSIVLHPDSLVSLVIQAIMHFSEPPPVVIALVALLAWLSDLSLTFGIHLVLHPDSLISLVSLVVWDILNFLYSSYSPTSC